ncbi:MAG TPA: hypothetical protein VK993_14970 [Chthoniobacterales bacterium]|nr:hypothetical protein [Chthoniobacterales bacterium]
MNDLIEIPAGNEPLPSLVEMPIAELAPIYFDPPSHYWVEDSRGDWIKLGETNVIRRLKAAGLRGRRILDEAISEAEMRLIEIQRDCDVAYAGPLAGHFKGLHEICGKRVLVTESPKLIEPFRGKWPTIAKLLKNLLHTAEADQRPYLIGWLKVALESLRSGVWRPGQALVLAGPRDCGKSLLQKLVTEALGGRVGKPYRYMTGGSDFNGELFGSEHLTIEDELSSRYANARRAFGASIKQFTVNEVQSLHAKGKQALSMVPLWRLTISVNDEPENLLILPPLDDSIGDKLHLLKCNRKPMPMPTETAADRKAFWQTLIAEMPAFLYHVENRPIAEELRCGRFGIKTYHHPDISAAIDELAPEMQLLTFASTPPTEVLESTRRPARLLSWKAPLSQTPGLSPTRRSCSRLTM